MADSIFTKIINREVPGHFLYEDEHCVVILDKFPTTKGQTMVIPKQEVAYLFDLDEDVYQHLFTVTRKIAAALDKAMGAKRTFLVVEGSLVPHVHIRMYPVQSTEESLSQFIHLGEEADDAELALIATQITAAIED